MREGGGSQAGSEQTLLGDPTDPRTLLSHESAFGHLQQKMYRLRMALQQRGGAEAPLALLLTEQT